MSSEQVRAENLEARRAEVAAARYAEEAAARTLGAEEQEFSRRQDEFKRFPDHGTYVDCEVTRQRVENARTALAAARANRGAAERAEARAELDLNDAARRALLLNLGNCLDELTDRVFPKLAAVVGEIHRIEEEDARLVSDAKVLAVRAGVEYRDESLSLPVVRLAVGVRLAEDWRLPELREHVALGEFRRALAVVGTPGTHAQTREQLRDVVEAWNAAFITSEPGSWLAICNSPAPTAAGGPYERRFNAAVKLLETIEELREHTKENNDAGKQ
jgi:multidrug efflux pump subunit AcrA (membrane-fusion protein)